VDDDKRARAQAERKADPPVSLFDIILVTARSPRVAARPPCHAEQRP